MVFAFVSCDDSAKAPEEPKVEYADSAYAKALIDSINKQESYKSIMSAVNGDGDSTLTIKYEPVNFKPSETTEKGQDVSIKVTATVKDYVAGFHKAPTGIDGLKLVSGEAEITVEGNFKKTDNGYSFDLKSYSGKTDIVQISDKNEEKHEFEVKALKGTATGTISLESGEFKVSDIALKIPAVKDVDVYLDRKPVDYEKLCEETEFTPGDDITVDL